MTYLTDEEKKMPLDMKLMQMALGLQTCKTVGDAVNLIKEIYNLGKEDKAKEILEFIEKERDNGNLNNIIGYSGNKGFDASLCLSEVIKMLEGKQ